jgi:hypothetical protein
MVGSTRKGESGGGGLGVLGSGERVALSEGAAGRVLVTGAALAVAVAGVGHLIERVNHTLASRAWGMSLAGR